MCRWLTIEGWFGKDVQQHPSFFISPPSLFWFPCYSCKGGMVLSDGFAMNRYFVPEEPQHALFSIQSAVYRLVAFQNDFSPVERWNAESKAPVKGRNKSTCNDSFSERYVNQVEIKPIDCVCFFSFFVRSCNTCTRSICLPSLSVSLCDLYSRCYWKVSGFLWIQMHPSWL